MTHGARAAALAAIVAAATFAPAGPAGAAGMEKASVALPTTSLTFAPNYVAQAEGFWKKRGLEVTLHNITGIGAMNAVLAGSIDFSNSSGPTVIRANIRGAKVEGIGVTLDGLPLEIVVKPGMMKAAGVTLSSPVAERAKLLKGKTVAIISPNTIPHIYLRYFVRKGGLDPERDMKVTSISPEAGLAALKNGTVQGYIQSAPWPEIAQKEGIGELLSSATAGDLPEFSPFAYNVVVTKAGFCDANSDKCAKLMAGYQDAMAFLRDHPDKALADLHKIMPRVDPGVLKASLAIMAKLTPASTRFSIPELTHAQDLMVSGGMIKPSEKLTSFEGVYTNKYAGK